MCLALSRADLVPPTLRPAADLIAEGRALAREWRLGSNLFLREAGVATEAEYKRRKAAAGRVMQHAHIGFRSVERTCAAMSEVHRACLQRGVTVDRFGITLDWSMGYPTALRAERPRGTGIVFDGPEDFQRIADAAPAATHFGDFMIGLPAAVENTRAALAAGVTAIGNLGQYFTFRLPYWDDDRATTEATIVALSLVAAQPAEVLVHSNLDDGFAGLFADVSSSLGMVLIEKYTVEELIGARVSHCYGHHFSQPLLRLAFHQAVAELSDSTGTMIFGNTVSYRSTPAANYASLANYLQADVWALRRRPTGHAINPVPVTENERIPDVDEIIDAQVFAARLIEQATASEALVDRGVVDEVAAKLVEGGRRFAQDVLAGLGDLGVDLSDAAELMLALRRVGPRRLEGHFGAAKVGGSMPSTIVVAAWLQELDDAAAAWARGLKQDFRRRIRRAALRACVGTTDVHEHGKCLVERALTKLGVLIIDGGVSTDPEELVAVATDQGADFIAISTYNGIALRYAGDVARCLARADLDIPVCIGGRLNQVPDDSNSGLPVDVTDDIRALGLTPCASLDDLTPLLRRLAEVPTAQQRKTRRS
jgi:methylmalonyl-CoA mutase cobalamin-binding subunit